MAAFVSISGSPVQGSSINYNITFNDSYSYVRSVTTSGYFGFLNQSAVGTQSSVTVTYDQYYHNWHSGSLFSSPYYTDDYGGTYTISASTSPIANINDAPTGSVTISGTATQGQTLTAANNTLADIDGIMTAISYQWYRNSEKIDNATSTTHALTQSDVGKAITVTASYTDAFGKLEDVSSSATAIVANINDGPTGSVTISGTVTQGQTLTAANNALADIDGIMTAISYQWYRNGEKIGNATSTTHALTQSDVGQAITVTASYTDAFGKLETVSSLATAIVANINDLPKGAVVLSGIAVDGGVLTVSNTLTDADGLGAISYQWYRNGSAIVGATQATYTLTQADVGDNIIINAAASYVDLLGTPESVVSNNAPPVGNVNDAPTGEVILSGEAKQGEILSVTNTLADADGLGSINYQWLRDSIAITDANQSDYTLTQQDVGKKISVIASYIDNFGTAESITSNQTLLAVENVNDLPGGAIFIPFSASQNDLLTINNTLTDIDGLGTIAYQWLRNGDPIANATDSSYALTQQDVDKKISVRVSYVDALNTQESVTSNETFAITNINDLPVGNITISGNPIEGETLTASPTLSDADGLGVISYHWLRDNDYIYGATSLSYTLTQQDVGKSISFAADYVDDYHTAESVSSAQTGTVTNVNNPPTGQVIITGQPFQGQTLTVANTLNDIDGLGAISYQWFGDDTIIANATQTSYTLTENDVGKAITAKASYSDQQGGAETVTSEKTALIFADVAGNIATTTSITLAAPVTGSIGFSGDTDWFKVELAQGFAYDFAINTVPTDGGLVSPDLLLRDNSGATIASRDTGTSTVDSSSIPAFTPQYTGTYYLEVKPQASGFTGAYTLSAIAQNREAVGDLKIFVSSIGGIGKLPTVGDQLTATAVFIDPDGVGALNYQWLRNGVAIPGETQTYYSLTQADQGTLIGVKVSYTDNMGHPEAKAIQLTQTVLPADYEQDSSTQGAIAIGSYVSSDINNVLDKDWFTISLTQDFQYQFELKGASTGHETLDDPLLSLLDSSGVVITSDDDGGQGTNSLITFTAPASGIFYLSAGTAHSSGSYILTANATHAGNHPPSGSVSISGLPVSGETLTASNTLADIEGLGVVAYQWLKDGEIIPGATDATYTLSDAVGAYISVQAHYTDGLGSTESVISAPTSTAVFNNQSSRYNDYLRASPNGGTLSGLNGNDFLLGANANDTLIGGQGRDTLTGGQGADVFMFQAITDSGTTLSMMDVITDFNANESDKINLSAIDTYKSFNRFDVGASFSGVFDQSDSLYFEQATQILYGNNDDDSTADFAIKLEGVSSLSITDIIL